MPPQYCLDADTFIQAKNRHFGMDFHPSFWAWLDQQTSAGVICSPMLVHDEIAVGNNGLATWVKQRLGSGLFVQPSPAVQAVVGQIADYVNATYPLHRAQEFLAGADSWVIAQAKIDSAIVVTHETLVPSDSSKVKIPNICQQFGVDWVDVFKMLRDLNARF